MQAVCEMLTITGKDLESDKKELDGYFATLDRWSKSNKLPSRTRFMVRDVLDLRRSRWVPRREALQVQLQSQDLTLHDREMAPMLSTSAFRKPQWWSI